MKAPRWLAAVRWRMTREPLAPKATLLQAVAKGRSFQFASPLPRLRPFSLHVFVFAFLPLPAPSFSFSPFFVAPSRPLLFRVSGAAEGRAWVVVAVRGQGRPRHRIRAHPTRYLGSAVAARCVDSSGEDTSVHPRPRNREEQTEEACWINEMRVASDVQRARKESQWQWRQRMEQTNVVWY